MRFFEDGKRRSFVLGLGNGMLNAYSILTGMAVGLLCSIDWRLSFWAYAGMALLFLATLFFLKEPPLPSVDIAVASKQNHEVVVSGRQKNCSTSCGCARSVLGFCARGLCLDAGFAQHVFDTVFKGMGRRCGGGISFKSHQHIRSCCWCYVWPILQLDQAL